MRLVLSCMVCNWVLGRRCGCLLCRLRVGGRLRLLVGVCTSGRSGCLRAVRLLLCGMRLCRILWTCLDCNAAAPASAPPRGLAVCATSDLCEVSLPPFADVSVRSPFESCEGRHRRVYEVRTLLEAVDRFGSASSTHVTVCYTCTLQPGTRPCV